MNIDAVSAASNAEFLPMEALPTEQPAAPGVFDSLVSNLGQLNTQMLGNEQAVAQLALGKTDNLHQVVMNSEQTKLAFELMLSVRSKLLDAYQDLMRMQV